MPNEWVVPMQIAAIGAFIFATGGLIFLVQFFGSLASGSRITLAQPAVVMMNPHSPGKATILDRISILVIVAVVIVIIAYSGALYELYIARGLSPVPPLTP
ncbi:MAG: hypothetical protein QXI24_04385 [Acidilobaceae archaeon]